jgi:hypothetical protein
MEQTMKRTLISYTTKPDMADKNAGLIAAVFDELKSVQPEGIRYLSMRLGDSFMHFVETEADDGTSALTNLPSFKEFQSRIRERITEPPLFRDVAIVGNYRMLNKA